MSLFQNGIEYGTKLAGRGVDHAEDLSRRGLLLQSLARFGQEPLMTPSTSAVAASRASASSSHCCKSALVRRSSATSASSLTVKRLHLVLEIDIRKYLEAASYCPPAYEVRSKSAD